MIGCLGFAMEYKSNSQSGSRCAGFTLIELLIVVVILSTLAVIVVPGFFGATESSRGAVERQTVVVVQAALERYYVDHGFYPGPDNWGKACDGMSNERRVRSLADTSGLLNNRLRWYTDAKGVVCDSQEDGKYPYGPYLSKPIPANPQAESDEVLVYGGPPRIPNRNSSPLNSNPSSTQNQYGWKYNSDTGLFESN